MKNIVKYSILSVVLIVSFFVSNIKNVEAGAPPPCDLIYNRDCGQVLKANHFAMYDLLKEYINGGYYDYTSASHKYYLPDDTIYMSDNIAPEVTVKITNSNCDYNPHTEDVRCYGDKKSKYNQNFVDVTIIVNDEHNYLASYQAFKSVNNNLIDSRYPTRFTKLSSFVEKTFFEYYENYESFEYMEEYGYILKELDYNALNAAGTFLKDTKSGLFNYTFKGFEDLKEINSTYIKVKVVDKKGNISDVNINLEKVLEKYNEQIKISFRNFPYMYEYPLCKIYGTPEYLCK